MSMKIISRGKGESVVAAAAYRAAETHKNKYDGVLHDYSRKGGVVYSDILIPDHAPVEYNYRQYLWNAVEQVEKAVNAQLAREVRLALPVEFDFWTNVHLVNDYVNQHFVSRGMCADISIHDNGDGNPHAHVLLTMRPLEQDGTWGAKSKMEYILDDNGDKIKLPSGRYKTKKVTTTDWDNRDNAEIWREGWANTLNEYLDKEGHIRVDHRSYERQGLDLIPTIHLGSVAHGLEKQGICTERGDINRRIKSDNARLRELNGEIRKVNRERHDILNPPKPQFLINLEESIKAQNSVGYANWASLFNLQQMAKTLIYIQENGYADYQSLHAAYLNSAKAYNEMLDQVPVIKQKLKDLRALKKQVEIYRKTADTFKKYNAPRQLAYFKNQFYENHKADIESHKIARAFTYDELKLTKFPSLKSLNEEINQLTEKEKSLREAMPVEKEKFNSLNVARHNAGVLLGYKNLEQRNTDPVTDIQRHGQEHGFANVPVFKATFINASKTGETAQYFQSKYLNRECAEAIKSVATLDMGINKNEIEVATRLIETYGMERVKWVLATVSANDTSNSFAKYKDWAEKMELPNEPIDKSVYDIGDTKRMLYPNLVRAVQIKDAEIRHSKGEKLSYEDSMAVAKLKVDEHNRRNEERKAQTVAPYSPPTPTAHRSPSQPAQLQAQPTQNLTPVAEIPPPPPKKKNRGMDR